VGRYKIRRKTKNKAALTSDQQNQVKDMFRKSLTFESYICYYNPSFNLVGTYTPSSLLIAQVAKPEGSHSHTRFKSSIVCLFLSHEIQRGSPVGKTERVPKFFDWKTALHFL
jgi:hypothetical protein